MALINMLVSLSRALPTVLAAVAHHSTDETGPLPYRSRSLASACTPKTAAFAHGIKAPAQTRSPVAEGGTPDRSKSKALNFERKVVFSDLSVFSDPGGPDAC